VKDYIDDNVQSLLTANKLKDFDSLWTLALTPVDRPNTDRGGRSEVARLSLKDADGAEQEFFIKRQVNHLSRSLTAPFGEPTFRRELRNILLYQRREIPALEAVLYAERKTSEGLRAIIITRALDDYRPLSELLSDWSSFDDAKKLKLLRTCGHLIGRLHSKRIAHRCCYPKHVFINLDLQPAARFIDLENARFSLMPIRDAINDLDAFIRRAQVFSDSDIEQLIAAYLDSYRLGLTPYGLKRRLAARKRRKVQRKKPSL
jgi:tRNA A-37 threonylcarbamoyl transferase component Bud32|tara:strand:- start:323 stop:1102 length:780 start_codon:yes stop_codon:yes gene_type:complete